MGTHDHGQGHATTFKQVVFDKLGIDTDLIKFKYGDTDSVMAGHRHVRLALGGDAAAARS